MSMKIIVPEAVKKRWELEAELYSNIATLHWYVDAYNNGELSQESYHRRLKSIIKQSIDIIMELERYGFNLERFIKETQLHIKYSRGAEIISMARQGEIKTLEKTIKYTSPADLENLRRLPLLAADFTANCIEIIDLTRLGAVATVDRLIVPLDNIYSILQNTNIFSDQEDVIKSVQFWIKKLELLDPGTIPSEKDLQELEAQAARWLNLFQARLKQL